MRMRKMVYIIGKGDWAGIIRTNNAEIGIVGDLEMIKKQINLFAKKREIVAEIQNTLDGTRLVFDNWDEE